MWFLWGLSSVIGGITIWSTHFTAMLAYEPGINHSYAFTPTALSLGLAITGLLITNGTLIWRAMPFRAALSGSLFGITVSGMHYLGMTAYRIPGELIWEADRIAGSIIAGGLFGALAYHRIVHPVSRYCWLGGALGIILAIASMHFSGMTAFTIFLDSAISVPEKAISDAELAVLVGSITAVLFLVGYASFNIEINLEREADGRLRHAATHDHLTGLPNRLKLSDEFTKLDTRLATDSTFKVAVLSIDLDLFKQVNDVYGHAVGDSVLRKIAARLMGALQYDEFIARTGGDEFIAIKHGFRRHEEVVALANRLHAAIIDPIHLDQTDVILGASMGIATTVDDGFDLNGLVRKSDQAMYRAKALPDCHVCTFNADIDRKNQEKAVLTNDLRNAAANGQLALVYQLQNSISTLEPVGFECLLRWNHPVHGPISPSVFIPLAEETGLIRDIGLWVLRTACETAARWDRPYTIAVNVAPQQLVQPSFVEQVADTLFETGLAAHRLEIELTEASMIDDQDHTLKVMHKLKELGVRIAMDDFGTGYSSLATLQAFPFDKIKIDRSFITDVHLDEQRAAIVRSTLLLGAALGIPVLAEGVETQQELTFLTDEKCNSVQGFFFGQPMSLSELNELLGTNILPDIPDVG